LRSDMTKAGDEEEKKKKRLFERHDPLKIFSCENDGNLEKGYGDVGSETGEKRKEGKTKRVRPI